MDATCPQSRNTSTANYSAILGGCGNNDNGIPFTGMYGCGLSATAFGAAITVPPPSAFWVDTMIGPNIPLITTAAEFAALPLGALYICNTTLPSLGSQPVFVRL